LLAILIFMFSCLLVCLKLQSFIKSLFCSFLLFLLISLFKMKQIFISNVVYVREYIWKSCRCFDVTDKFSFIIFVHIMLVHYYTLTKYFINVTTWLAKKTYAKETALFVVCTFTFLIFSPLLSFCFDKLQFSFYLFCRHIPSMFTSLFSQSKMLRVS